MTCLRDPVKRSRGRTGAWTVVLLVAAFGLLGCNRAGTVEDVERWTLEPALRIGEIDGPNGFARITELEVGARGEIYVAEWSTGTVRVFDATGRPLRPFGRSGDGPGEFTYNAGQLWQSGDSVIATDPLANRFHTFRTDGTLLETSAVRGVPVVDGTHGFVPVVPLADGTVLGSYAISVAGSQRARLRAIPVVRFDSIETHLDTIALVSYRNVSMLVMLENGGFATNQPLQDGALWRVARDRTGIIVVDRPAAERADGAHFMVTRLDLTGDTVSARTLPYTPIALDEAMTDSMVERFARSHAHDDRFAEGALRRAIREALYRPGYLPPVTDLVAGRDGTIWLRREEVADSVDWLVLDERGEPLARLLAPAGLRVHRADRSNVWGVVKDELDVEYVVRFAIQH
jgi:hypothetical protein